MLRPIRRQDDVFRILREIPLSHALSRVVASGDGSVAILGRFTPPGGVPFVAVHVSSEYGREWHVRISVDVKRRTYRVERADGPPDDAWRDPNSDWLINPNQETRP